MENTTNQDHPPVQFEDELQLLEQQTLETPKDENEFVVERKQFEFTLVIDGQRKKYVIREMISAMRDDYLNAVGSRLKGDKAGGQRIGDFKGLQAALLTRSMFDLETGKLVTEAFVQSLPASIQNKLFKKSKEISALGKEAEEEEEGN